MVNPSTTTGTTGTNDIEKNINSLLLNDNSTTSTRSMTQLDMEHTDRSDENEAYMEGGSYNVDDGEMEDYPPLSTYLAGWKYWCQFAIWPLVFLVLNGVVVSTLVAYNAYEYGYGDFRYRIYNLDRNTLSRYDMMKYNRIIIAVLLFIDALIIYRAVVFLDKKVRELDMIGDDDHDDGNNVNDSFTPPLASSTGLKPNVHAQVSRKLDTVLGRNPQARISILVSILWLLFVGCGTVGIVSVSDLLFALSPKGKKVCTTSTSTSSHSSTADDDITPGSNNNNNNNNDDGEQPQEDRSDGTKDIPNIPGDLQKWAKARQYSYGQGSNMVHLTNGVTFVGAVNPLENNTMNFWTGGVSNQLVSIGANGNITFYKNIQEPSDCTSISGDNQLSSTGFCCAYRQSSSENENNNYDPFMIFQGPEMRLFCTQSHEAITDGVFPNTTLFKRSNKRNVQDDFRSLSIKSYKQEIWVKVLSERYDPDRGDFSSPATIYTANISESTLILNKIAVTSTSEFGEEEDNPFLIGSGSPCYRWTSAIDAVVFAVVLLTASAWLTMVKNLSVGIVPAVFAISMTLSRLNHDLGLALSSLSALAAFIGLLGCIHIPLNREKLIWGLYTLLFCVAGLVFSNRIYYYYDSFYNFNRALTAIIIASVIGFVLNHPVLYLLGWIGGIWAIFCGIFLLFTPAHGGLSYHTGIFSIGLGIFVGSGCATIGFNLTKYRAHVVYYLKRAWFAMNAAMKSSSGNNNRAGHRNPTAPTARYAPVMHAPQVPPVATQQPGFKENDITAGLLNQNNEGRSH